MSLQSRCALFFLFLAFSAHATAIIHESIEQMARRAPTIVRGIVERQASQWDADHRHIETLTDIRVTETLKGRSERRITVSTPGGEVDGIGQRTAGVPVFRRGEEVVLFLEPSKKTAHFQVSGLAAGKVTLENSPLGHKAVRKLEGLEQLTPSADGVDQIEVLEKDDLGSADAFLKRVRKAIVPDREGAK